MSQSLEEIRGQIDQIDRQMVDLFKARMEAAAQVAEYKMKNGLPVLDAGRERALLGKIGDQAGEELADYAQSMYRTILAASRSYQNGKMGRGSQVYDGIKKAMDTTPKLFPQRPTVACQGIEGAYSQIACDRLFKSPNIVYVQTFDHVFKAVESGMCQYGLLPIENSTAGSVTQVYDLMEKHSFHIVGARKLRIDHRLMRRPGATGPIREIVSHEQALRQCSEFFAAHPEYKSVPMENTSTSCFFPFICNCSIAAGR